MDRNTLTKLFGPVWNTEEIKKDYIVGKWNPLMAPFVSVRRKSDGAIGTGISQSHPRLFHTLQVTGDMS